MFVIHLLPACKRMGTWDVKTIFEGIEEDGDLVHS